MCYKAYEAWLDTQHVAKIKCLQMDHGGEYLSHDFDTHLKAHGTVCSLTVHNTPEENGIYEHLNHTLLEHACAMHPSTDLPKFLWAESVQHATWLKNHTSMQALNGKTPFEMLFKQKPKLENLPEWGTRVFVLRKGCSKLDEKAEEGRWVGYSPDTQGHRIYWPGRHHVSVERNIVFDMTVPVQRSVVEGEQNAPNIDQTPTQNPALTRTASP